MTNPSSTPGNRNKTLILLTLSGLLTIAATAIGIDDNPPGVLLAFLAAIAFVLAFVHPWRSAKPFLLLLLVSVLGFVLFFILTIIFDSVTQNPASSGALKDLIQSPAMDVFNLIIVMISPAAFIVGAVGAVVMFIRNRRSST